jgi:uncharacterized protein (DUF433 family)
VVAITKTEHPYVTRQEGMCGGRPIVDGRRIPVWQIAALLRQGLSAEQIVDQYSDRLTPAAIYDAISYYYDHRDEVDADLESNTSKEALGELLDELGARQDRRGVIRFGAAPRDP